MFGEEIMMFQTIISMDSKNRIIIPAKTHIEKKDSLVLYEEDFYLTIYSIKKIEEKLNRLNSFHKKFLLMGRIDSADKIQQEINYICSSVAEKLIADSQHRIILPKIIVDEYDFKNKIFIQGEFDHINLFNNEQSFRDYKKLLKEKRS